MLSYENVAQRRFPERTLASSGASNDVDGVVGSLTDRSAPRPHPADVRRLIRAIAEVARARL
ncbi:hypothetical protein [Methylobacterium sp. P5_C11]